jgi:hypothetical protein
MFPNHSSIIFACKSSIHATDFDSQLFGRMRDIAMRAFWPKGRDSVCEGYSEI